jgi:Dyp-type peroxidase family
MTTKNEQPDVKKINIEEIIEVVTPFDEFEHEPLLDEIQGNILKSHGRNHADYLFLKFKGDKEVAKKWIGSFTHRYVTSALEQAEEAKQFRQNKNVPGKIFANFFLTSAGYEYLGYPYQEWPGDDPFRRGMKESRMLQELGDDTEQWDKGFNDDIHALVLLAADRIVGPRTKEAKLEEQRDQTKLLKHPFLLQQKREAIKKELKAIADVVHQQIGYVLRDEQTGEEIEHFGFRDGVSQPLFLKRDIDKARNLDKEPEYRNDFSKWDPRAPLNLVLFKDSLGKKEHSYGSFLVFRKLEQNVGGWNRDVVRVAKALKVIPEETPAPRQKDKNDPNSKAETMAQWMDRVLPTKKEHLTEEEIRTNEEKRRKIKLVDASAMGRFKDGQPVVLSDHPSSDPNRIGSEQNDFNHAGDSQGSKCPFFAHTRKTNPRGDTANNEILPLPGLPEEKRLEEEKMHRIVRRAINYGTLPSEVPEDNAGLLFMCFQANLNDQFNFMQKVWVKDPNFVKRDVGTDVVIGLEKKENDRSVEETYQWPTNWNTQEKTKVGFKHWVTMKGGEFFFAPSMSFLKDLNTAPSRNIVFRGVPKQEIEAAKDKITELKAYRDHKEGGKPAPWAIGLNGDTVQPDGFLTFFNQRKLPFKFYLLNQVGLGEPSAYDTNIETLEKYIKDVVNQEIDACEYKIAELKEYKDHQPQWAIGLTGDTSEPDGFVNFFGERDLPFKFYVRSKKASLGDPSAYDQNIATLEIYSGTLKPFQLVIKKNLHVLTVDGDETVEANIFVAPEKGDRPSQLWLLEAAGEAPGNGYYYLVAQHSNMVLSGAIGTNTNNVVHRPKDGTDKQQWKLEITGDGYYYLVAKRSDNLVQVLTAVGDEDSANVILKNKSGSDNQKWTIK